LYEDDIAVTLEGSGVVVGLGVDVGLGVGLMEASFVGLAVGIAVGFGVCVRLSVGAGENDTNMDAVACGVFINAVGVRTGAAVWRIVAVGTIANVCNGVPAGETVADISEGEGLSTIAVSQPDMAISATQSRIINTCFFIRITSFPNHGRNHGSMQTCQSWYKTLDSARIGMFTDVRTPAAQGNCILKVAVMSSTSPETETCKSFRL
jgi:hypothetical protein